MKKIVLSTLILSSILYGSNNVSELEQAIENSDFKALKTLLTKRSIDKNECARMADLSQQITSQRNKALISPSWAKAITSSALTLIASLIAIERYKAEKKTHNPKLEATATVTGLGSLAVFTLSTLGLIAIQAKAGFETLHKTYNSWEIRKLLKNQQISNENQEMAAA